MTKYERRMTKSAWRIEPTIHAHVSQVIRPQTRNLNPLFRWTFSRHSSFVIRASSWPGSFVLRRETIQPCEGISQDELDGHATWDRRRELLSSLSVSEGNGHNVFPRRRCGVPNVGQSGAFPLGLSFQFGKHSVGDHLDERLLITFARLRAGCRASAPVVETLAEPHRSPSSCCERCRWHKYRSLCIPECCADRGSPIAVST